MGLGPLYPGTIHGSAPFIRRDDIWVWALYTQGSGQGLYIYIHITQHIYMCVHMSCLSHARVVPILDVPTVPRL